MNNINRKTYFILPVQEKWKVVWQHTLSFFILNADKINDIPKTISTVLMTVLNSRWKNKITVLLIFWTSLFLIQDRISKSFISKRELLPAVLIY